MATAEKSFSIKSVAFEFEYESGVNMTVEGLAADVKIKKPGAPDNNSASVKIWGLSRENMEQLTTLSFLPMEAQKNLIRINAGPKDGNKYEIFYGEISQAWADFNGQPDIYLSIEAQSGFYPQRIAAEPLSVDGDAQVAGLIAQQANEIDYSFLNRSVTASVRNAYYSGSPLEKIKAMAQEVGAQVIIDDGQVILMDRDGARSDDTPYLDSDSGLIGHPTFNQDGISAKCFFRNDLQFGGLVQVESIVPKASGVWKITNLSYNLAAYKKDGGGWECAFDGQYYG